MDIRSGFSDRTIFISGGTGFVGKVLLYKILKEFPDVRLIYLLVRGKKSRQYKRFLRPQERLELDVLSSPCFEPIRKTVGDAKWGELCGKVRAMHGDITEDHLGLSEQDRVTLAKEVQIIIHLAATVNFNERLDLALQMNTLGAMRTLVVAKTCERLEVMVHVSTCYVNYARQGLDIVNEEVIYAQPFDVESMVRNILCIHPKELKKESALLLKRLRFPNTYTFTKNLGEQLLQRYREDIPLCIVRPSIVGCSYYEPFPGWVDTLTAAGGLILTTALGVVKELLCRGDVRADIIPVDFVVNIILKAAFQTQQQQRGRAQRAGAVAAIGAKGQSSVATTGSRLPVVVTSQWVGTPKGSVAKSVEAAAVSAAATGAVRGEAELHTATPCEEEGGRKRGGGATAMGTLMIYQAATSSSPNGATWDRLREAVGDYMRTAKRHPKAMAQCGLFMTPHRSCYMLRHRLLRVVPYQALSLLVRLPEPIGSQKNRDTVDKMCRAVRRADMLNWEFSEFTNAEWVFSCRNSLKLDDGLNEHSKKAFAFNPYDINWFTYTQLYTYGLFKNILKEVGDFRPPMLPPSSTELFIKASSL